MKADHVKKEELGHLLAALTPPNRLAMEISLATGLRIGDVLNIRSEALKNSSDGRFTVRELKTGKNRRIRLSEELYSRAISMAGRAYLFENRFDWRKPRTRQAVYKDLNRIARMYRMKPHISPHTARKAWAVEQFKKSGDLDSVQRLMNHTDKSVTMIYAMADVLTEQRLSGKKKN